MNKPIEKNRTTVIAREPAVETHAPDDKFPLASLDVDLMQHVASLLGSDAEVIRLAASHKHAKVALEKEYKSITASRALATKQRDERRNTSIGTPSRRLAHTLKHDYPTPSTRVRVAAATAAVAAATPVAAAGFIVGALGDLFAGRGLKSGPVSGVAMGGLVVAWRTALGELPGLGSIAAQDPGMRWVERQVGALEEKRDAAYVEKMKAPKVLQARQKKMADRLERALHKDLDARDISKIADLLEAGVDLGTPGKDGRLPLQKLRSIVDAYERQGLSHLLLQARQSEQQMLQHLSRGLERLLSLKHPTDPSERAISVKARVLQMQNWLAQGGLPIYEGDHGFIMAKLDEEPPEVAALLQAGRRVAAEMAFDRGDSPGLLAQSVLAGEPVEHATLQAYFGKCAEQSFFACITGAPEVLQALRDATEEQMPALLRQLIEARVP